MKNIHKILLFLTVTVIFSGYPDLLNAQYKYSKQPKVEITASGLYFFGGILPTTNGQLNFVNNFGFGGALTYYVMQGAGIDISYLYVPTELRFENFYEGTETKLFDMDIHHFYLSYIYENPKGNVSPYGLLGLGAALFDPKDNTYDSETRFSITMGGGIKINPSKSVGIKFQARLLFPWYWASSTVYVGEHTTGYGVGAGAVLQADLSAGISVKF